MNRVWWFLRGFITAEVTGAGPDWFLNRLTSCRIPFWDLRWIDEFTVFLRVFPRDLRDVERVADETMCTVKGIDRSGMPEILCAAKKRVFLWIGTILGIIMLTVLPQFVLFYEVQGNDTVPDEQVLRGLEELGIGFGSFGPRINTPWVENHLLNLVDGLQWVTINQSGCRAVVVVRERPQTPAIQDRRGFCNIVASRDGIITSQSVWTGQPLHQTGDAVLEGELLVSGVVDLERTFLLTRAQAEIYALTCHQIEVSVPDTYEEKGLAEEMYRSLWLEIGKFRIKIFGNSGISTAACDKMIDRKILSLPGGFELPVSLMTEVCTVRSWQTVRDDPVWTRQRLLDCAEATALSRMTAGEILRTESRMSDEDGVFRLQAELSCREMIARTVEANWIEEEYSHD